MTGTVYGGQVTAAKLPALEHRHLMRELVDLGLAIQNLAVLGCDGLIQVGDLLVERIDVQIVRVDLLVTRTDGLVATGDLGNQITGDFAQLLCVQTGQ